MHTLRLRGKSSLPTANQRDRDTMKVRPHRVRYKQTKRFFDYKDLKAAYWITEEQRKWRRKQIAQTDTLKSGINSIFTRQELLKGITILRRVNKIAYGA